VIEAHPKTPHHFEPFMKFEDLLKDKRFSSSIGPEKIAIYTSEKAGEGANQMWKDYYDETETVLSLVYLGGFEDVGIIDFEVWHGFYVWSWTDTGETGGVSDNLESFFGQHPFDGPWADPKLHSQVIPLEKLKSMALHITPNEGNTIQINGAEYERRGKELVEVKQ